MVTFSEGLEMFSFPVVKSSFCFAYLEIIAIPSARFVDNFRKLRAVQAVLVCRSGGAGWGGRGAVAPLKRKFRGAQPPPPRFDAENHTNSSPFIS